MMRMYIRSFVFMLCTAYFLAAHSVQAAPTLTVLSPNGGEGLYEGTYYQINWKSDNVDKVSIGWSTGVGSLNPIVSNIPNTGSYSWKVGAGTLLPGQTKQVKIDVIGYQTGVGSVSDQSDGFFSIKKNPATTTPIRVVSPNGGELWGINRSNTITWTPYGYNPDVNPSSNVTAYLEQATASGYVTIGKIVPSGKASIHTYFEIENNGKRTYPAPGKYYVRVVNNTTGMWDRSDSSFKLEKMPHIDSVVPSVASETSTLTFTGSNLTAGMNLYDKTGTLLSDSKGGAQVFGTSSIKIKLNNVTPGEYNVFLKDISSGKTSNSVYLKVIHIDKLQLTAPNSGEQWVIGELNSITWAPYSYDPRINPAGTVRAFLETKSGNRYITVGEVQDQGKASMHTRFLLKGKNEYPKPGEYYVRIQSTETGEWDRSDIPFNLVSVNDQVPGLSVVRPNGSEIFRLGDTLAVEFEYKGISSPSIALYEDDKWMYWLEKDRGVKGVGKEILQYTLSKEILNQVKTGKNMKIYITARTGDGSGYVDAKSASFVIEKSPDTGLKCTAIDFLRALIDKGILPAENEKKAYDVALEYCPIQPTPVLKTPNAVSAVGDASCESLTRDLTYGTEGGDVAFLQSFLSNTKHLTVSGNTPFGHFGKLTQSALAAFQESQGISPASGYFGAITRAAVIAAACSR
ncbi:MAG: peptidoglycan-binding protein [Candidatus Pacebacteria bacterium]|nr:peptidoglycan-binding protein [Candidatus Paceibacterota bacterium]